jgi:hypothetical protein
MTEQLRLHATVERVHRHGEVRRLMKRLVGLLIIAVLGMAIVVGLASADSTTYTLQCGTDAFIVVKPNENAALYTDGNLNFVTAIGAIIGNGAAPNAVLCTINGFGPIPFIVTPR